MIHSVCRILRNTCVFTNRLSFHRLPIYRTLCSSADNKPISSTRYRT
ncbi:hypothetical protein RvY_11294 [Ramazzottius varieornatus]|uniref:Uncharacterized protein n=1 Tax=Ramazzottius varieornatus TaxID=947166 RepID=A0A1D1VFL3_RAMVA|nr:hypothetical protein RvY_11294 [Ramazzottius varieornatus]